jgi:ribosomal protein S12 methylthiotransferase accessory factor
MTIHVAVMRAITEMNQSLPAAQTYQTQSSWEVNWWRQATVADMPYLAPHRLRSSYPLHQSDDVLDDVKFCLDVAAQHQMDVLVLNQTRPDIGLPVVKVFAPGLRHFWSRFAPGRLYDVPMRMGYSAKDEAALNPYPMFL